MTYKLLTYLQQVVEARQRFDEHVAALVAELVATGSEEVERLIEVEVEMSAATSSNTSSNHALQILRVSFFAWLSINIVYLISAVSALCF